MKILLFILLLFLMSCATKQPINEGRDVSLSIIEYPDGEIYPEIDTFKLRIKITNQAKNDIQGILCVSDSLSDNFGGISSHECQDVYLEKGELIDEKIIPRSQDFLFPEAKRATYSYIAPNKDISEYISLTTTFQYEIESISSTIICVSNPYLDDPYCNNKEIINNIKRDNTPLIVSKIEKSTNTLSENEIKLNLKFYLELEENGYLLSKNSLFSQEKTSYPEIEFRAILNENEELTCTSLENNIFKFKEDQNIIQCSIILPIQQDFIQLKLDTYLGYGFMLRTEPIQIKLKKEEY